MEVVPEFGNELPASAKIGLENREQLTKVVGDPLSLPAIEVFKGRVPIYKGTEKVNL